MTPEDQLSGISQEIGRYGTANGHAWFDTEDDARAFAQILSERYPTKGYGTYCSAPQEVDGGYMVAWYVGSAE